MKLMAKRRNNSDRLPYGSKALIGSTLTRGAQHTRGNYYDSPERGYLQDYEGVYRNDPYVHTCLNFIADTMIASLGSYLHDDPRAVEYVNQLDARMEGTLRQSLWELIVSSLWSGFGVSEKLYYAEDNRIWLKALVNYHPISIYVVPNKAGLLTENQNDAAHQLIRKTGIWQRLPMNGVFKSPLDRKVMVNVAGTAVEYVRLPMKKLVFVHHGGRHGNHMGESRLASVWQRIEMLYETWKNLMITTERYGSPQVAAIVPRATTSEVLTLPGGGSAFKSLAQKVAEQMGQLSVANGLVIEEPVGLPGDPKVRIQNISSFNNFAEAFHQTIAKLYRDIMVGLGVPPLLFLEHAGGLSAGTIAKVHAETYKQLIVSLHKDFVEPFTQQLLGDLLKVNFGLEDPGRFAFKPFDISAADTIMQTFAIANEQGLLDFSIAEDLQMARAQLGFDQASDESMATRLRNNKSLMEAKRRHDVDKVKIAEIRHDATIAQAEIMAAQQDESSKRAADTQVEVAKLKLKEQAKKEKAKLDADADREARIRAETEDHQPPDYYASKQPNDKLAGTPPEQLSSNPKVSQNQGPHRKS